MQWTHPSSLRATKCKVCQYDGRLLHLYSMLQESELYSYFEIQKLMWSYAVTCCADCIRLLAGRGMNIYHEVLILEHSNPHTVFNKHKELLQSGNLRKIQHMVLTLPSGLLFLGQWHNTCKVTNSTVRIIQEPSFCHYSCKNLAKMRQAHQHAVGLCQKIMTLKWNNCASFCVVATVIQITSMT